MVSKAFKQEVLDICMVWVFLITVPKGGTVLCSSRYWRESFGKFDDPLRMSLRRFSLSFLSLFCQNEKARK